MTYRTPCRARGHFAFCYDHVTYKAPSHAGGHLVIFYHERTPSCYFQGLPGAGSLNLTLAGLHVDIFET